MSENLSYLTDADLWRSPKPPVLPAVRRWLDGEDITSGTSIAEEESDHLLRTIFSEITPSAWNAPVDINYIETEFS